MATKLFNGCRSRRQLAQLKREKTGETFRSQVNFSSTIFFFVLLPLPPRAQEWWPQTSQNSRTGSPSVCMVVEPCSWCLPVRSSSLESWSSSRARGCFQLAGRARVGRWVERHSLSTVSKESERERGWRVIASIKQFFRLIIFKIKHNRPFMLNYVKNRGLKRDQNYTEWKNVFLKARFHTQLMTGALKYFSNIFITFF